MIKVAVKVEAIGVVVVMIAIVIAKKIALVELKKKIAKIIAL